MNLYRHPGAWHGLIADNRGLWPNVKRLDEGTLGVFVYNRPSHGHDGGDVEMHVSRDGGRTWSFGAQVSEHAGHPEHVRMNHAVAADGHGRVVALVSGYSADRRPPHPPCPPFLPVQYCLSEDAGRTWTRRFVTGDGAADIIPFGDAWLDENGDCTAAFYAKEDPADCLRLGRMHTFVGRLDADGCMTGRSPLASDSAEATLLRRQNGDWLAVGRDTSARAKPATLTATTDCLALWRREAGTGEWEHGGVLTLPGQVPAGLAETDDGAILMVYGSRIVGLCGILATLSEDGGRHWAPPVPLVSFTGPSDCGYPSLARVDAETWLAVWYAGPPPDQFPPLTGIPDHPSYHTAGCLFPLSLVKPKKPENSAGHDV